MGGMGDGHNFVHFDNLVKELPSRLPPSKNVLLGNIVRPIGTSPHTKPWLQCVYHAYNHVDKLKWTT